MISFFVFIIGMSLYLGLRGFSSREEWKDIEEQMDELDTYF